MIKYPNVSKGLKILFFSELIQIVGGVLSGIAAVSVVGIVLKIMGLAAAAYGISGARKDSCAGFDTAFIVVAGNALLNIILIFLPDDSKFASVISLGVSVLSLMVIYYRESLKAFLMLFFVCTLALDNIINL